MVDERERVPVDVPELLGVPEGDLVDVLVPDGVMDAVLEGVCVGVLDNDDP